MIFAVVNQKGGVGKTTTAVNTAACVADRGKRVLLVDMDPQGNATSGAGVLKNEPEHSVYDVLINDVPAADVIVHTPTGGLDVLPARLELAGADIELMAVLSRETKLKKALEPVAGNYDYIFIDCPPSLGLLTVNVLTAAERIILPIQCEYYALEGITQLLRTVDLIRQGLNPTLDIAMIVMTMFDYRTRLSQQVVDEVRSFFGDKVSPNLVPRNVRLSEAPSHGLPIAAYDSKSKGAQVYGKIAEEVISLER
ncbi:MAG: ParA family protein [Abditibacteriota bacterium]|nr:ParA family protein [Abditibacteriota bacterium]MBP5092598.1 ParA family protein [Abditibacteriota bacterium]